MVPPRNGMRLSMKTATDTTALANLQSLSQGKQTLRAPRVHTISVAGHSEQGWTWGSPTRVIQSPFASNIFHEPALFIEFPLFTWESL